MLTYLSKKTLDSCSFTYDSALPQDVYNKITLANGGDNPLGHIVALYPGGSEDGYGLMAVTAIGAAMLVRYYKECPVYG